MSQFIVGLTGGIGSGKTTVSNLFAERGITVVDADVIARQVVKPGTPLLAAIHEYFGDNVLLEDGNLNRRWLREAIFGNQEDKKWLESVMHPAIRNELLSQLRQASSEYAILSAPLLIENQLTRFCDRVLVVDVSEEAQYQRTINRDQSNAEQVRKIIESQVSRSTRLKAADDVIDNSGNPEQLPDQVQKLHESYLKFAKLA